MARRNLYSEDTSRAAGSLSRIRHRQKIGIGMLYSGQLLRSLDYPPQTLVVKLVGGGPRRAPAKHRTYRNSVIFLRNVLVDCVIGEAGQCKTAAREKNFDLIGTRELGDA